MDLNTFTLSASEPNPVVCSLTPVQNFTVGLARSALKVEIPAFRTALIPVKMSRVPVNDIPVLFEPIGKLSSTHCLAGVRSLHKPTRKGCLVKIMNPMPAPFTVYNNQVLGKLFPITDIRAFDFDLLDGSEVNSVGTE